MLFESTGLWTRAMSVQGAKPEEQHAIERLTAAYRSFWANACELVGEIGKNVPNLTLHDERHFEALWQRADLIAGPEYRLSPLEAFVFGGAILLHDAANCVAAFPGRMEEIRKTTIWQDTAADWMEAHDIAVGEDLPAEATEAVLFDTLRALHADRAKSLAFMSVGDGAERLHLIGDPQPRVHCGEIMGLVAASHHWDVSELSRLPHQMGVLAGMPQSWQLRPVVLAGLLRCADAVQIDQTRVPDFLFYLLDVHGVSADHWKAQNALAAPFADAQDPSALCFNSTRAFTEADANAWWVAREAIAVADRELRATDALLRDLRWPPFAINRIRDAASPDRLAQHVRAEGWRPVAAEVRISQVGSVVEMFGGEQLYGDEPIVPLRELIQNAVDALQQRRALEPGFEGRVTVRLEELADRPGFHRLSVEDDGIGMSEAALTGPLIDFGASYTGSGLMKREYPGLRAKRVKRVGRYGVGFFSVFMISSEVSVTSRPYDKGLSDFRTLKFRDRLKSRPLLMETIADRPTTQVSTRVSLVIATEVKEKLLSVGVPGGKRIPLTLAGVIGALCPMVDADIWAIDGTASTLAHRRYWHARDRREWLEQLFPKEVQGIVHYRMDSDEFAGILDQIAPNLRFIDENDPRAGLACLFGIEGLGVSTVGGLRETLDIGANLYPWAGAVDFNPKGPKREGGSPRALKQTSAWATLQAKLMSEVIEPSSQLADVAKAVFSMGGNAGPVACARLNGKWVSLTTIAQHIFFGAFIYCPVDRNISQVPSKGISNIIFSAGFGRSYSTSSPGDIALRCDCLEGLDGSNYYSFWQNADEGGFLAMLMDYCHRHQYMLHTEEIVEHEFAEYIGVPNERDGLIKGLIAKGPALKLWAEPMAGGGAGRSAT